MFTFNSRNIRTRCNLLKIANKDSRAMISLCLGVDWVPWRRFKANIYLLNVNNICTRIRCEICSKLAKNSTKRYKWHCNDLSIDNFKHVALLILLFLLLYLGMSLFARLDEYNIEEVSGKSFVSNVSDWNTQFFLFEKICGVNSQVYLPSSEVG